MKTQNLLLSLCMVAFASCQTETLPEVTGETNSNKITLNASTGVSTKLGFEETTNDNGDIISISWQPTDSFSVYTESGDYVGDFSYSSKIDSELAKFEQVGDFSMDQGSYIAVIPASGEATINEHYASLSLNSQTSTLESLSYLNNSVQLRSDFDYDGSGNGNFTFGHELCLLKVDVKMAEGQIAQSIKFTDGEEGNSYTLSLPDNLNTQDVSAYIAVAESTGTRTLYFEVESSDGSIKEFSGESTKPFIAGKFYNVSLDFSDDLTSTTSDYYTDGYKADNGSMYIAGMSSFHKLYNGVIDGEEKNESFSSSGVYFLDPEDENHVFEIPAASRYNFVIIGRHSDKKPKVKLTGIFYPVKGSIIFKNVEIEGYDNGSYSFGYHSTATTIDYLAFDDCTISTVNNKPLTYFNQAKSDISNIIIRNSKIKVNVSTSGAAVNVLSLKSDSGADKNITLENNEIFAPIFAHGPILQIVPTPSKVNLNVTNNTFINYLGNANGLFKVQDAADVKIANNIFWGSPTKATDSYVINYQTAPTALNEEIVDNIFFGLGVSADAPTAYQYYIYATSSKYTDGANAAQTEESASPFSVYDTQNSIFTQKDEYSQYGSNL